MKIAGVILLWVMFVIGFVFSGFFQNYFLVEGEYVRDTLIIHHLANGMSGSSHNCSYYGVLLSNNEPAGLSCKMVRAYFGDERMNNFNRIRDEPKELRMPVFTYVPRGGAHVYLEDKKSYYPGAMPRLPVLSIPTLLMLPLLLMFLTRYLRLRRGRRNQLGLWLLVLWCLGATGLYDQAGSGGDTFSKTLSEEK